MKARLRLLVLLVAMLSVMTVLGSCSKNKKVVEEASNSNKISSDEVIADESNKEDEINIKAEEAIIDQEEIEASVTEEAEKDIELPETEETEELVNDSSKEETKSEAKQEQKVEPKEEPKPEPTVKPKEEPEPTVKPKEEPKPEPTLVPTPEPKVEPTVVPTPEPKVEPKEEPKEEAIVVNGIKDLYASYGMLAGTCINGNVTRLYSDNIIENYNSITLENEMKPDAILSHSKSVAAGDLIVEYPKRTLDLLDWAKKNNMKARGHVLVWHSQTPNWIFYKEFNTSKGLVDRDTMLARMESYIKQNFELLKTKGYSDMFYAYDIVNEALEDNGTYRDSLWKKTIGDDYIWQAFYYADKYAPEHIKLYYNDYNEQFKTNHVVKLAKSLVDKKGKSLIDGIGCQGHLYTGDSIDNYIKTLEVFSATGLDVHITEIDVSLGTWQNILQATDANLKTQGKYYYDLVNRIIEGNKVGNLGVSGITFWGVSDGVSWRRDRSPLLYDRNMKAKYAYYGAIQDKEQAGY